jgi:two-component system sensor histidine kinase UhpB
MHSQTDLVSIDSGTTPGALSPVGIELAPKLAYSMGVGLTLVETDPDTSHNEALRDARRATDLEIDKLREQVRQLSDALLDAAGRERRRLAQEMHDELGAHLTAARLALARLEIWLPADAPPSCATSMAMTQQSLDAVCEASHRIVADLQDPRLDTGLADALAVWATQFSRRTGLPVRVLPNHDTRLAHLSRAAATALYRVAQEALNNVAKHAGATQVEVSLEVERRHLTLVIQDNGCGLSRQARAKAGRFGLSGMRARCEAFGGTLKIQSSLTGSGATVRARLPWGASRQLA